MVKYLLAWLLIGHVLAAEVKMELLPDQSVYGVNQPVTGSLLITHESKDPIDLNSFTYKGKPLKVDFIRKARFEGSDLIVETLRFTLEPLPAGKQRLSPIEAKVGAVQIQSLPAEIEVKEAQPLSSAPKASVKPLLKLEAILPGPGPFYPGQRVKVGYRYIFQGDIELREEVVPLLDQNELPKIGEKEIVDSQTGTLSTRQITQTLELVEPGEYSFPPSTLAGYAYLDKGWGPKVYFEPELRAQTPPSKWVVTPFPETGKPPFFTGALGSFQIERQVIAPPSLHLGDKLTLKLILKGRGEFSTLKPPSLICQPGWNGWFSFGDLPPQVSVNKEEVIFTYEIRPLSLWASELPPIHFAYFDPKEGGYSILKTEPFKLTFAEKPEPVSPPVVSGSLTLQAELKPIEGSSYSEWESLENQKLYPLLTGSTYEALGDVWAALERGPEAIWAYEKALQLSVWNPELKTKLSALQKKLYLLASPYETLPVRAFWIAIFLSFLLGLLFKRARSFFITLTLFILTLIFYSSWIAPEQAIILRSTLLYASLKDLSLPLSPYPAPSGSKVEVLGEEEEGRVSKIRDVQGRVGYVKSSSLRLL